MALYLGIILFKELRGLNSWIDAATSGGSVQHQQHGTSSSALFLRVEPPLRLNVSYQPSSSEEYTFTHAEELGFLASSAEGLKPSCAIFTDPTLPVYDSLQQYRNELKEYNQRSANFTRKYTDLRKPLRDGLSRNRVCQTVDLNLESIFKSKQLSHGDFGYAEPLIPPLRDPEFCFYGTSKLMSMAYLIHDWPVMCRRLTPFSKTVFIDMGASLAFHRGGGETPAVYILETYKKFGFHFDHVYAYEITQQKPAQVFEMVPSDLIPNYHWMNVGVESDPQGKMNPLRMLLEQYTEEDFVVIKLDIDTSKCTFDAANVYIYILSTLLITTRLYYFFLITSDSVELPLAFQILEDDRYSKLVDQFYFEHHVFQKELAPSWRTTMKGSVKESLDLFRGIREKGIASHYWV